MECLRPVGGRLQAVAIVIRGSPCSGERSYGPRSGERSSGPHSCDLRYGAVAGIAGFWLVFATAICYGRQGCRHLHATWAEKSRYSVIYHTGT